MISRLVLTLSWLSVFAIFWLLVFDLVQVSFVLVAFIVFLCLVIFVTTFIYVRYSVIVDESTDVS